MRSNSKIRAMRIQTLANRLLQIAERRLLRRGQKSPIIRDGSYEDRVRSGRQFAAAVLQEWRRERPETLRRLIWSDAL